MRAMLCLALSLAPVSPALAQQPEEVTLTFNHVALHVTDLDRSAAFYGGVLNLRELSRSARSPGVRWFSLGEGKELHLISPEYFSADAVRTNKAVHMALTTRRFDDLLALLRDKGIVFGDWNETPGAVEIRSDGARQIFLQDPDGYWIEINSVGDG